MLTASLPVLPLVDGLAPHDAHAAADVMSPMVSGLSALAQSKADELGVTFAAVARAPAARVPAMSASANDRDRIVIDASHPEDETKELQTLHRELEKLFPLMHLRNGTGVPLERHPRRDSALASSRPSIHATSNHNHLASRLPDSRTFMLPGKAHIAFCGRLEEILSGRCSPCTARVPEQE